MPTSTTRRPSREAPHWYHKLPTPDPPHRRKPYASSVFNNVWNAWSNWGNAVENNPAGILQTMRVNTANLAAVIASSALYGTQKLLLQQLILEVEQALATINPAILNQQVQASAAYTVPMVRHASEESVISSNAKALGGVLRYLQDASLFPNCAQLYGYVAQRIEQIYLIMDGDMRPEDVTAARQQQMQQAAQAQQTQNQAQQPQLAQTGWGQAVGATQPTTNQGGVQSGQAAVPSPVAGLKPQKDTSWEGTDNLDEQGNQSVGSFSDWFSLNGTTLEQFVQRCSKWAMAYGQDKLAAHLQANSVPPNVINQVLPYM